MPFSADSEAEPSQDRPPVSEGSLRLKSTYDFKLHDVESLRVILRGSSVIDWHRLNLEDPGQIRQFIENHETAPLEELLSIASGRGHRQQCACTILKVMHIINHLAGRELLFRLPVSDRDLFHLIEEKVYRIVGTMLSEGFPITEFVGGRKNLDSTYTKLLSKAESTAVAVYDKLRFRIVTRTREDLLPVLLYLSERLFPFNYVVPQQSTNTIFHFRSYCEGHPHLRDMVDKFQGQIDDELTPGDNRFSAPEYRVIHFVADVPVRVPVSFTRLAPPGSESLGPVVYLLCEFQLVDAETEA